VPTAIRTGHETDRSEFDGRGAPVAVGESDSWAGTARWQDDAQASPPPNSPWTGADRVRPTERDRKVDRSRVAAALTDGSSNLPRAAATACRSLLSLSPPTRCCRSQQDKLPPPLGRSRSRQRWVFSGAPLPEGGSFLNQRNASALVGPRNRPGVGAGAQLGFRASRHVRMLSRRRLCVRA
jgi:hypothetical protein